MPAAVRHLPIWVRNYDAIEAIVAMLDSERVHLMHLVELLLWVHYNTVAPGAGRPRPSVPQSEESSAPAASLNLNPVCEQLATARVWWRTDALFAQQTVSAATLAATEDLFNRVRQEVVLLVSESASLRELPGLRHLLLTKVEKVALRVHGVHLTRSTAATGDAPSSLPRELLAAAQRRWEYVLPFGVDGRWFESADSASASSDAFYNAFDNSVTIMPGMLTGAFAPPFAAAQRVNELVPTLGFVLAHELGHAVDTTGTWFNENGTWSDAHRNEMHFYFHGMRCLIDVFDENGVDGLKTLNENFADSVAYQVIGRLMERTNQPPQALLAQAQLWCGDQGPSNDVHAPGSQRVNLGWRIQNRWLQHHFGCHSTGVQECTPL